MFCARVLRAKEFLEVFHQRRLQLGVFKRFPLDRPNNLRSRHVGRCRGQLALCPSAFGQSNATVCREPKQLNELRWLHSPVIEWLHRNS